MDMSPDLRKRLAQHAIASQAALINRSDAAVALVAHWVEHGGRATFRLFVEVALPLLDEIAAEVRREVGVAVAPQDLSASFIQGQFLDLDAPAVEPSAFWREARRELIQLAELEVLRFQSGGYAPEKARDVLDKLAFEVASEVGQLFHRLDREHRRTLLVVDVERLADYEAAVALDCDVIDVATRRRAAHAAWGDARLEQPRHVAREATVADLVYELAKNFALSDSRFRERVACIVEPRQRSLIQADLRQVLESDSSFSWFARFLDRDVEGEACDIAVDLLGGLRGLEGASLRCQTLLIHLWLRLDREENVEEEFARAFTCSQAVPAERLMLIQALLRFLVRSDRYSEASGVIDQLPDDLRDTPEVALSAAALAAERGAVDAYVAAADTFRDRPPLATTSQPVGVMTMLEYIAEHLERPLSLVMRDFGLSGGASLAAEGAV